MYKDGEKVKIIIEDPVNEICEIINGATGVIVKKDVWVFPYTVKLDCPKLNKLIVDDYPRRFAASELIAL